MPLNRQKKRLGAGAAILRGHPTSSMPGGVALGDLPAETSAVYVAPSF